MKYEGYYLAFFVFIVLILIVYYYNIMILISNYWFYYCCYKHLDQRLHDEYLSAEVDRDGKKVNNTTKDIVKQTGTIHDRREMNRI